MITNAILSQFASVEPFSTNYLVAVNEDGLKALVSIRLGKRVSPYLFTAFERDGKDFTAIRPDGSKVTAHGISRFISAISVPSDPITAAVIDLSRKLGANIKECIGFVHGTPIKWPVWVFGFYTDGTVFDTAYVDNFHAATAVNPWGNNSFKVRVAPENIINLEYADAFVTALKNAGFSKGKTKQYYGNEVSWLTIECSDQADVLRVLGIIENVYLTCSADEETDDDSDADVDDADNDIDVALDPAFDDEV